MDGRTPIGDAILGTEAAKRWLAQFHRDDVDTAKQLLCSLRFVSTSHYDHSLMRLVHGLTETRTPVALFATRKLTESSRFQIPRPPDPLFFDEFGRPRALVPGEELGSEGATAFLMTRLGRAHPELLVEPCIERMRQEKCRRIVFVDDLVGSGTRTRIFSDAVYRNPTIKSWTSFHWIDGAVAAYGATEAGEEIVLSENRLVSTVQWERRPEADARWWDDETRRRITSLCVRYAKRTKLDSRYRLGVGKMLGSLIFEHGCTNVTPSILWETTASWEPLFHRRTIPAEMGPLFQLKRTGGQIYRRLYRLGYKQLKKRELAAAASPALGVDLAAFLAAAARLKSTKRIAPFLGITFSECDALAGSARSRGFLDDGSRLTELGREELARLVRAGPRPDQKLPSNADTIYIPLQLRAT